VVEKGEKKVDELWNLGRKEERDEGEKDKG
jgi:hypothetical protein